MSKRDLILTTAKTLFIEQGFRATTIAKIAEQANIAKGSIYSYFSSKNDIIKALMILTDETRKEALDALFAAHAENSESLVKEYIELEFAQILGERDFIMSFINGEGITLDEEMMAMVQQWRVDFHLTQQYVILQVFGEKATPFLLDITTMLNAFLQEYSIFLTLDEADFSISECAKFIEINIKSIANNLIDQSVKPFLTKDNFPLELPDNADVLTKQKVTQCIKDLSVLAQDFTGDVEKELTDTLVLIKETLAENNPNKTLLRAFLANLRNHMPDNAMLDRLEQLLALGLSKH